MEFIKKIKTFLRYDKVDLTKKVNTLELENEILKEGIKNGFYEKFMDMLNQQEEIERLRNDNKRMRKQIKELKEEIKNG